MRLVAGLLPLLIGLGLPFAVGVWTAARVARIGFPLRATLLALPAYAAIVTLAAALSSRISWIEALPDQWVLLATLAVASATAAPAVWRLTGRWWALAALPIAGSAAAITFDRFKHGTHGPWYIRNEGLALMLSALVSAAVWHTIVLGAMLRWAALARSANRPAVGARMCAVCGYDLAGLRTRNCPECGRPIGGER